VEPAFHWSLAAGDAGGSRARCHLLLRANIEQLSTHIERVYERNTEWEKARAAYTALLIYAQETSQPVMEKIARNRLATLALQ
jgi:hypothetical protein